MSWDDSLLTLAGCECRMLSVVQVLFNISPSPSITSESSILPPDSSVIIVSVRQLERWLKTGKIPNSCSLWKRKFLNSCSRKQLEYIYFLRTFQAHTQDILFTGYFCLQDFRAIREALSAPKPRLLCFVVAHGVKEVNLVVFFAGVLTPWLILGSFGVPGGSYSLFSSAVINQGAREAALSAGK